MKEKKKHDQSNKDKDNSLITGKNIGYLYYMWSLHF